MIVELTLVSLDVYPSLNRKVNSILLSASSSQGDRTMRQLRLCTVREDVSLSPQTQGRVDRRRFICHVPKVQHARWERSKRLPPVTQSAASNANFGG